MFFLFRLWFGWWRFKIKLGLVLFVLYVLFPGGEKPL